MKLFIATILILLCDICFSQVIIKDDFVGIPMENDYEESGKNEFKLQAKSNNPNYIKAFNILSTQVKSNPKNAEVRYFLGYTIDRLNTEDGNTLQLSSKEMTIKSSEQFEKVNELEPMYKGEEIILDPYSKITAIWGSLAMSYLNKNLQDSAIWAFMQGKARGGFTEPILSFNRQLLNDCSKNSILITYGDLITIPIWYLQTIEKLRVDIAVVDANLLNTVWYTKYLKNKNIVKISYNNQAIEKIEYVKWQPKKIVIANPKNPKEKLNWTLYPSYLGNYILKGDRILLDIFKQNYFTKDIYFTANSNNTYNLFLEEYLKTEGILDKVSTVNTLKLLNNLKTYNINNLEKDDIIKSSTSIKLLAAYRWAYYNSISNLLNNNNFKAAKELLVEMNQKFDMNKLPYASKKEENIFKEIADTVNKN